MPEKIKGFWRNRDIHFDCACYECVYIAKHVVAEWINRNELEFHGQTITETPDFGLSLGVWLAMITAGRGTI